MSERLAFEFNATRRTQTGKPVARRLRKEFKVPAIVYGADKMPEMITLELKDVMKALSNEAVYSHILTLNVDGHSEKVVLKALSRHHLKTEVTHMDFMRIRAGDKITMHVPLHFIGEETCPGVKDQGGVVSHLIKDIEVKCLPDNLPEYLEVDISTLQVDESVHMSQIRLPSGVELVTELDEDHDQTVVSIQRPRVEREEAAEESEALKAEAEPKEKSEE